MQRKCLNRLSCLTLTRLVVFTQTEIWEFVSSLFPKGCCSKQSMSSPSDCLVFRSGWDLRTLMFELEPPEQLRTALDSKCMQAFTSSPVSLLSTEKKIKDISCNVSSLLVIGSFCERIRRFFVFTESELSVQFRSCSLTLDRSFASNGC